MFLINETCCKPFSIGSIEGRGQRRRNRLALKDFCVVASICCAAVFTQGQTTDTQFDTTRLPEELDVEDMIATFSAMYKTRFERLDIDEDGYVSKHEYLFLSRLPRNELERSNEEGEDTASSSESDDFPLPSEIPLDVAEFEFRTFDADKDERISREEMTAYIEQIYIFDINKDGKIERSEVTQTLNLVTVQNEDTPETE